MTLLERIEEYQLMVAVRTDTPESAFKSAEACIKGGVNLVEITFSVPEAAEVIKKLRRNNSVVVGAGTVLSISEAKKAIQAGAEYIVSPNLDEKVVKFTKKEGALSIPGACTPTEIYRAYKAGGDIIKLFPFVEIGGLDFLKVIRGPLPFIKYMLSGGVTLDNISRYLAVKASCILVGSAIIKRELVMAEDWASITELSKRFIQKIQERSMKSRY
ncbi:MAG: bifunctional 4-hydroxy-2-oxoglutarate aldolase/2-dehydro-3-deoxy-phosphogluconate aldolase [Nitrospira sp.]|nr:bifunctional 4-hydroxy-2-oxoglutarate aldolase/2-dehydro-3-deoxy-phosphogluconate aldolase [Nitrospira sp.]